MGKELKQTRKALSHQVENINKEIEIIKKEPNKFCSQKV